MPVSPVEAKDSIDRLIRKARVHLYKPIQIAEVLFQIRRGTVTDPLNLEQYRRTSKTWRDAVTKRLIGNVSNSSARYQDNLFETNAIPPQVIAILSSENTDGKVENYIYQKVKIRLSMASEALNYILTHQENFDLSDFHELFISQPGLKRSVDKAFEIAVYSYIESAAELLGLRTTVQISNTDTDFIEQFDSFINTLLDWDPLSETSKFQGRFYRVGTANAADRGLDIWSNLGLAVQIKHCTLTKDMVVDISKKISADHIVIACLDAADTIQNTIEMENINKRITILTFEMLKEWYDDCFTKEGDQWVLLRTLIIDKLSTEFQSEFPSVSSIDEFLSDRGYRKEDLTGDPLWKLEL